MVDKKEIFIWVIIAFVILVIILVLAYTIVKSPGRVIVSGGLEVVPVSEPPDPVGLTYSCQNDTECQAGLVCDPNDYTCRMGEGSPCYQAADCKFGLICSGVCVKPDNNIDVNMDTYVDSRYVCNPYGLACDKGAKLGDPGNPNGAFCCVRCEPGDVGCTPGTTCGPVSSQDGYTLNCNNTTHRNCPCQQGKGCVKTYDADGVTGNSYECRVLPDNPCVCSEDCITRSCIYYADGTSSKYPVGICRGPVGNGQFCTVDEGCQSNNCSINPGDKSGFCQPPGISNGETGAYCNNLFQPTCTKGSSCINHTCVAPNAFGFQSCDSGNNICGDSFFCGQGSTNTANQIIIHTCGDLGSTDNCVCMYGNPQAGIRNTTPDPIGIGNNIAQCLNGMEKVTVVPNLYCGSSVTPTPVGFINSAPCLSDTNCVYGKCLNNSAIYRFLPAVSSEFPIQGLQGLNGVYFERIPTTVPESYGTITKIFGMSNGWSVTNCENSTDENCQTLNRGTGDTIFTFVKSDRVDIVGNSYNYILYKNLTNGTSTTVYYGNNGVVMDSGSESNREEGGWTVLIGNQSNLIDADAYWSNGKYVIYTLWINTINPITYAIYKMDLNGQFISSAFKMPPNTPNPPWTSITCSDYYTPSNDVNATNSSIILSNNTEGLKTPIVTFCSNLSPTGTWKNIASTPGKVTLGFGAYKNSADGNYNGYPAYGKIGSTTTYQYFSQPSLAAKNYVFSNIQYPQNTYISNLNASATGSFTSIVPPAGTVVTDYSTLNVLMASSDKAIQALQFAYIAKWGSDNNYYVYYVGTGFSIALPVLLDGSSSKVLITPGNLYIYSKYGCLPTS